MEIFAFIPARYGSTRFPGKPLVEIAGRSMVSRVAATAMRAADAIADAAYVVATRGTKHRSDMESKPNADDLRFFLRLGGVGLFQVGAIFFGRGQIGPEKAIFVLA